MCGPENRFNRQKGAAPGPVSRSSLRARLAAAVLLLILSASLMILAANCPRFAEWYSENIYPVFVNTSGRLWGFFPFSVSELLLYILTAAFLISLAGMLRSVVRNADRRTAGEEDGGSRELRAGTGFLCAAAAAGVG